MRRRHRRNHALAGAPQSGSILKRLIVSAVLLVILFYTGRGVLRLFNIGSAQQQLSIALEQNTQGGVVQVSIEGGEYKRAETGLKLYPGDKVKTSAGGTATLTFFDDTQVRLSDASEIILAESDKGEKESQLAFSIVKGSVWVAVPSETETPQSTTRTVSTEHFLLSMPTRTEAVIASNSITVFAADHLGVTVALIGKDEPVMIGEGQIFTIPENGLVAENPYTHRSPLNPLAMQSPFVETSRKLYTERRTVDDQGPGSPTGSIVGLLEVSAPIDGITVQTSTINVTGTVDESVRSVRINGYLVEMPEGQRAFTQELALPDQDEVSVIVEALAADGTVAEEIRRTVLRDREPPVSPVISSPAEAGQTYMTNSNSIEISGTAPADAIGIIVNEYRLQFYQPGDKTWSYLAGTNLGNLQQGENVYRIVALNAAGLQSEPAEITVIVGAGEEGVVVEGGDAEIVNEEDLPSNVPMLVGSLHVTAPEAGSFHEATTGAILIEGTTSQRTASVWVNDYQLQLYEAGKTTWNYIADIQLNTLKRGANAYHVVARDSEGKVLDELEYTIHFDPRNLGNE